ncbi:hypothetical protein [Staphylococcus borealis]|uniref:hypothetical protein n=1 Tax=Staphylococcus borealis TaxID=2742203 RepID=UPI0039EC02A9
MYTHEQIRDMIFEYHWRRNRLVDEGYTKESNGTAQYGIEATMPKGKGHTSNKVLNIVTRNDTLYRVLYKHIEIVEFIDKYEHKINDDMNLNILYEFKKGKNFTQVKKIMKIGRDTLNKRIDEIVNSYINQQEQHKQQHQHNQQLQHNKQHQH